VPVYYGKEFDSCDFAGGQTASDVGELPDYFGVRLVEVALRDLGCVKIYQAQSLISDRYSAESTVIGDRCLILSSRSGKRLGGGTARSH
jgi:hypothetical protein